MINNFVFNGNSSQIIDGKNLLVPVPTNIVLKHGGASIPITITHPSNISNQISGNTSIIPSKSINALIDTGASISGITLNLARQLGLIQTGFQNVSSVHDNKPCPVYFAQIIFNWGASIQIPLVGLELKNIDCLIGRDVLMNWHFTYNGKNGTITICD